MFFEGKSSQKHLGNIYKFFEKRNSFARVTEWQSSNIVLKERDAWSDLANFIGEMVAKYAESMDLDNLPDPDFYLHRERIRQLYTELYKEKNITQFRNTKISIERKVAA